MSYFPDQVNFKRLPRSLMFCLPLTIKQIIKEVKPNIYEQMKTATEYLKKKRKSKRLSQFEVSLPKKYSIQLNKMKKT